MREIIFQELRECSRQVSKLNEKEKREWGNRILLEGLEKMFEICQLARKEGLLALEEAVYDEDEIYNGKYLKKMILLIVDGTEPEMVEEISLMRFFSRQLSGYEAWHYLLLLIGSLGIQQMTNIRVLEEKLLALVPDEVENMYHQKQREKAEKMMKQAEQEEIDLTDEFFQGDVAVEPGDEYYFQIKITDYAIRNMPDRGIQRMLGEVENSDLGLAMKVLSGEARNCLFKNMSTRIASMLRLEMEVMGPVRLKDVAQANIKIFETIVELIKCNEIVCADAAVFCSFDRIFHMSEDEVVKKNRKEIEDELYKMMREYDSFANKIVDTP